MSSVTLSRREFLKISGVISATIAISTQIPFRETLLREVSAEEAEKLKAEAEKVRTEILDLCMGGSNFCGDNTVAVDIKNGRVIRIRPLHLDWNYKPEEFNADVASFEVAGKVFKP
ncbi:MAG: hypothetical protein QXP57_09205, partial [Nitrososphaerota archaeon]